VYVWLYGEPIGLIRDNLLYYVHTDHLGRPEVVTNQSRADVWRAENLAWDRRVVTDTIGAYQLGFPGQYLDGESAQWYNWFRTYDGSTGRYTQADPIGLAGGMNTYLYANANPVMWVDPLGLKCAKPFFERAMDNFVSTNEALPGVLAPIGMSFFTANKVAAEAQGVTVRQAIAGWRAGSLVSGAATLTKLEIAVATGGTAVLNFALVGTAFEVGVAIGSIGVAAIAPCDPTPKKCE